MLGFLKKFLGKEDNPPPCEPLPSPAPGSQTISRPALRVTRPKVQHERVLVSLRSITDLFPAQLRHLILGEPAPAVAIAIAVDSIMERLSTGCAQATLGELRKMSPPGVFVPDTSHDNERINLPLQDILRKLDPSLFKRTFQTPTAILKDLGPVFEKEGSPLPPEETPATDVAVEPVAVEPVAVEPVAVEPVAVEPVAVEPAVAVQESSTSMPDFLWIPLEKFVPHWPQGIRAELTALPLEAALVIPLAELGEALRHGKVKIPWARLQKWINPPMEPCTSPLGCLPLELPLPIVAPLFMASCGGVHGDPAHPRRRVSVDDATPSFFIRDSLPAIRPPVSPPPPAETVVTPPPTERLPAELVDRACTFPGVAGAIITLADGLLVAAKLPPELRPETVAAFLPQVFSRLEQAAQSMELGKLQNIHFTADQKSWQIWKTGSVFFAALGHANALLPVAQLQVLVLRLARENKT